MVDVRDRPPEEGVRTRDSDEDRDRGVPGELSSSTSSVNVESFGDFRSRSSILSSQFSLSGESGSLDRRFFCLSRSLHLWIKNMSDISFTVTSLSNLKSSSQSFLAITLVDGRSSGFRLQHSKHRSQRSSSRLHLRSGLSGNFP